MENNPNNRHYSNCNKTMEKNNANCQNEYLKFGMEGEKVKELQVMLVAIYPQYPSIGKLKIDGVFGDKTQKCVMKYQSCNSMPLTGIVDKETYEKLIMDYGKRYEYNSESRSDVDWTRDGMDDSFNVITSGSKGDYVRTLQMYINAINSKYPEIPRLVVDGIFGPKTKEAVLIFQRMFNLATDGIVGEFTWAALYEQYENL